jgi:hypothetical protein
MGAEIVFSGGETLRIPGRNAESVAKALAGRPVEGYVLLDSVEGSAYVLPGQVAYVLDVEDESPPSALLTQAPDREDSSSEFG